MVFEWKSGSRVKADAQKVGEELEAIELRDASSVVKIAREKEKSELHKCFEWDDAIAGEEYRKDQARYVMRMIVTQVTGKKGSEPEMITVRAFESIRFVAPDGDDEKAMVYVPIREVLSDGDMKAQVISRLMSTIAEAEQTASNYSHILPNLENTRLKLHEARETLT